MAFPPVLFALMATGSQVKIEGAVRLTRKPILVFDKEMFRDTPPVIQGEAEVASGGDADLTGADVAGAGVATVEDLNVTENLAGYMLKSDSSVVEDDNYNHVPKRLVPKLDTLVEFWDDADLVGLAMSMDVELTDGSGVITVPNAELLTPGQGISGDNIPLGAIILSIFTQANGVIDTTKATMSKKATATGDSAATLTGSNKCGEFMQSEFIDWGSDNTTPT